MTSNERLAEVIAIIKKNEGLTNEELSTALRYKTDNYVSDILGGSKPVSKLFLGRLEEHFNVNIDYIEKESGSMFNKSNILHDNGGGYLQQRQNQKLNSGPYMVPLISIRAQAGYSRSYINNDFLNKMESYPIVPGVDPHGAIWRYFQVNGDSMLPFLNNGDYVLSNQIAKEDWPEIKDYHVYVIVTDELVTIKRVFKRKKELVLIPENEKFDQKLVSLDDIKEIWRYRRHIGWNASSPKKFEIKI